ncbi:DUF221-domain-containing protein, partial [Trametopsis cervina]
NAGSASSSTFVTALVFNAIVFAAEIAAFTILRPRFPAIYQPRTFAPSANYHVKPLSEKWWGWPMHIFQADFETIKAANGLDAYFFVRFLWMMVRIMLPIWPISWMVLMPIDAVKTGVEGNTGLDIFTFGNIGKGQQSRYAAHIVLAWVFTFWILWNLRKELRDFVLTRQAWLTLPENANSAQSNTVLITGIPQKYLTEAALTDLFDVLPGGVRKVWLNRDLKDLPALYTRQTKAASKLEAAETKLLKTAIKLQNKQFKSDAKAAKKAGHSPPPQEHRPLTDASTIDTERNGGSGGAPLADAYVPTNKRPSHRLPPFGFLPFGLPFMGRKVDTIDWARNELISTSTDLTAGRRTLAADVARSSHTAPPSPLSHPDALKPLPASSLTGIGGQTYGPSNAAFILFNTQIGAHLAQQALSHHAPYRMSARYTNVSPSDVLWPNLNVTPYSARARTALSWAFTLVLILFWAVPVAFVGAVSNVHALCSQFGWLAWICGLPSVVVGIISGILPPALLAVLMLLLPVVLRMLSRFEGTPTRTAVELSLMTRYFLFQVLHSFLIVTVSSGIVAALPSLLNNPASVPTLLAQELPKASTFFLTYIVLQGLSGSAAGFLSIAPLVLYYVKLFILGGSPRSVYKLKYGLRSVSFGTLFPTITLLVVITITYSIIAPVINGLACVTFFLFYMLYKYLFLWQLQQPRANDTGGMFFPKAIQHVFVGLYIEEICLAALFFLAQDGNKKASAIPEGVLMIVLIVITIGFHLTLNNSYGPLINALPLSLSDRMARAPAIEGTNATKVDGKHQQQYLEGNGNGNRNGHARGASIDSDADTYTSERKPRTRRANINDSSTPPLAVGGPTDTSSSSLEDFAHPASVASPPIVWIPQDVLGLGEAETAACESVGVRASMRGARMDGKGRVDVEGVPPGEDVRGVAF